MYNSNELIKSINRGKEGYNTGIPMGHSRLIKYIPNIQQATYYLIGGDTGTGKSSYTDHAFVLTPYNYITTNDTPYKLQIDYFSLEMSKISKLSKFMCYNIYQKHGILVDVNYILSRGKNRISEEIYNLVISEKSYIDELSDVVNIFDDPINPTGIKAYIGKKVLENGKINTKVINTTEGDKRIFESYVPHNPNLYHIVVIDHIGLLKQESKLSEKGLIDLLSSYMVDLRNKYNIIPVIVQQLNRNLTDNDRFNNKMVEPSLRDFRASSDTQHAANIVLSLFAPNRYNIKEHRGYNIEYLRDYYRSLSILKNRDGESDVAIGMLFRGEVGYFQELPKSEDLDVLSFNNIIKSKLYKNNE